MLTILRTIGKVNICVDNAELKGGKIGYYIQNNGNLYTREQASRNLGESTVEAINEQHDSIMDDINKIVEQFVVSVGYCVLDFLAVVDSD